MAPLDMKHILPLQAKLARHSIYQSLRTLEDLRVFMTHHVFAVWDFMSRVKYLQRRIILLDIPWMPRGDPQLRCLINQLVLAEESDPAPGVGGNPIYGSYFEYYCDAMGEIGADARRPWKFLDLVRTQGIDAALYSDLVPLPTRYFSETTFGFIREDNPPAVAAALALGREQVIPEMFGRFLDELRVNEVRAPIFHHSSNTISSATATTTAPSRYGCWKPCAGMTKIRFWRPRPPPKKRSAPESVFGTASWTPSLPAAIVIRQ